MLAVFALLAFALGFASDYLSTLYTREVAVWQASTDAAERERASVRAARASVAIWLVGSLGLFGVVELGWWLLLPEGLGFYLGTRRALR